MKGTRICFPKQHLSIKELLDASDKIKRLESEYTDTVLHLFDIVTVRENTDGPGFSMPKDLAPKLDPERVEEHEFCSKLPKKLPGGLQRFRQKVVEVVPKESLEEDRHVSCWVLIFGRV
jgi:hypothetical protein